MALTPFQAGGLRSELTKGLGIQQSQANDLYISLGLKDMTFDKAQETVKAYVAEHAPQPTGGLPQFTGDLGQDFPKPDKTKKPAPNDFPFDETPVPASELVPTAPATPIPPAPKADTLGNSRSTPVLLPNGGARFWRNIDGTDVELFITDSTDLVALLERINILLTNFQQADWIVERDANKPIRPKYPQYKPGDIVTFGVDDKFPITHLKITTYGKTWLQFFSTYKKDNPTFETGSVEYTDQLIDVITGVVGKEWPPRVDILHLDTPIAIQARLGRQKEKDGVPKPAGFLSSFFVDEVLDITLIEPR